MQDSDLIFYAMCTFWTGDLEWLWQANGHRRYTREEIEQNERDQESAMAAGRPRPVLQPHIPHCPNCKAVGFQTTRKEWFEQAQEFEDGVSPPAKGKRHPGYVEMLKWGEKKCFPSYAALERAWVASKRDA